MDMENTADFCSVVVTDDDADDRYLIKMAMDEIGLEGQVHFAEDGESLLERLEAISVNGDGDWAGKALPCLILLDLNMPRMDGRETLRALKNDPRFKQIPVVILTNSQSSEDVDSSYRDGANSFFSKPLGYSELVGLVRLIQNYWLQGATLPTQLGSQDR